MVVGGGGERCWCEVVVRAGCDRWWQCELVILRGDDERSSHERRWWVVVLVGGGRES